MLAIGGGIVPAEPRPQPTRRRRRRLADRARRHDPQGCRSRRHAARREDRRRRSWPTGDSSPTTPTASRRSPTSRWARPCASTDAIPTRCSVAFRVHARRGDDVVKVDGVMTLATRRRRVAASTPWTSSVTTNTEGRPASTFWPACRSCPSEGGPPPSSAPLSRSGSARWSVRRRDRRSSRPRWSRAAGPDAAPCRV